MPFDNKDGRMRGRKLQERRLRIWKKNPHCAMCGRLVSFTALPPRGFELDHIEALNAKGSKGADVDENCQVLCVGADGCHAKKTARDMGYARRREVGEDGWPGG